MVRLGLVVVSTLPILSFGFVHTARKSTSELCTSVRATPQEKFATDGIANLFETETNDWMAEHATLVSKPMQGMLDTDNHSRINVEEKEVIASIRNTTSLDTLQNANLHLHLRHLHPRAAAAALKCLVSCGSFQGNGECDLLLESIFASLSENTSDLTPATALNSFVAMRHYRSLRKDRRSWPVQERLWIHMESVSSDLLREIPVNRLAKLLQEASRRHESNVDLSSTPLYDSLCVRLGRGDALGDLSATNFRHILRTIVLTSSTQHDLILAMLKRLRKQSARNAASTNDLVDIVQIVSLRIHSVPELQDAAQIAAYTLAKHVFAPPRSRNSVPLTAQHAYAVLQCLQGHQDAMPAFIHEFYRSMGQEEEQLPHGGSLDVFCDAAIRWGARDDECRITLHTFCSTLSTTPTITPQPRDVTGILRAVGLLFRNETDLIQAAHDLTARNCLKTSSFVSQCSYRDLSNIAWFFATKAGCVPMEETRARLAVVLVRQWLAKQKTGRSNCAPKLVCRFLSSITAVIPDPDTSIELSQLFQACEGALLDHESVLDTLDVTSTMVAYAKRPSQCNTTMFSFLANTLAKRRMERITCRQTARSLWACGKVAMRFQDIGDDTLTQPARAYLQRLTQDVSALGPLDVSQSIWALARMGGLQTNGDDGDVNNSILALTRRARSLDRSLNDAEVANVVWGISKLHLDDFRTIFVLTRRYCTTPTAETTPSSIKPEEASGILYALGRLDIRDEDVFRVLTDAILLRVHETNAQAVTNVMWAHRNVHIQPPLRLVHEGAKLSQANFQRRTKSIRKRERQSQQARSNSR